MPSPSVLSRIPVVRILVPFILGIAVHKLWHCWWAPLLLILAAAVCYWRLSASSRTPQGSLRWRAWFILPLAICGFALGWLAADIHCPARLADNQRIGRNITGRVSKLDYTDFSMRLFIDVLDQDLPPCKVLVSTRGCDYTMRAGDLVVWPAELHEVNNAGNPDEMDYAGYLLDSEGIRYQQHLTEGQVVKAGHHPTLLTRLANIRRDLQLKVFNSRLSPAAQQFVVALLLGESDMIDKGTRQEFASAGVAHVLALSGLHVGFIALIIWWMLFPLDYLRLKKVRLVVTLAAITLFAVFTGLSPSVLRATIMIGFVFASLIFHQRSASLNALAMAALVILVFNPSAIYSVGFQLSFITVGAVLMFARVPQAFESRYKVINYITATAITSLVAMLATVALSAHYFHTISFMSVLANLLILPVLPLFMVVGALFLLVTAAGMEWNLLDWTLDAIYRFIHWATTAVNSLLLSHVSGVWVSTTGVVIWFVLMALVLLWLYRREYRYLLCAGIALIVLLAHSLWIDAHTPRRGAVIFNAFTSTPILYYDHGTATVWIPDDEEPDSAAFTRYHAGFLARHSIDKLQFVTNGDTLRLDGALFKPPYAFVMGRRIMAAGSGRWKSMAPTSRLELDDLIVTKRFHGNAAKLQELYRFDRLVISGASHDTRPLQHECDSLHITVHDLSAQGAIIY